MERDGQALLLLVAVLVIALVGIALYVSGAARRAELASRGGPDEEERGWRRIVRALDARLRRTERGRRLASWLSSGAVPVDAGRVPARLRARSVRVLPGADAVPAALDGAARRRGRRGLRRARTGSRSGAARAATSSSPSSPTSRGCWPTARPPASRFPPAIQLAARELDDPAATELRTVIEELRVGQPVDEALDAMRRRLPSREIGVLMTTLVIQQRAGGDTVRALNELGHTLEARKDLMREIKTVLSGSVFTSYLVVGIGVATIVLLNLMSPGVMREMATSAPGLAALAFAFTLWTVAFVLIRRTTKVEL